MTVAKLVLGLLAWISVSALSLRADEGHRAHQPTIDVSLIATQLPLGSHAETAGPRSSGMLRADYGEGARLVRIGSDGTVEPLSGGFASAADPCVSFDGKRLLFAAKRDAADHWNIFEMTLADRQTRQVTRDLGDCRSPIYLSSFYTITEDQPWDQIAFVGTRAGTRNEFGAEVATSLYTCKPDGTLLQRITYNLSSDFDPAILADGRLVYATWRRARLEDGPTGRITLETVNVDGIDRAPFVGRQSPRRILQQPCEAAVNGAAVFVETDKMPWDGAGQLARVSTRRPLHTYEALTKPADGLFHSPSALPGGEALVVSRRPAEGSGTHGLYRFDLKSGKLELIHDDPAYHEIQGQAIWERRVPDGRSSVVSEKDPLATLYCLDVYQNKLADPTWLQRGAARSIRIVEGLAPEGQTTLLAPRRILAEVPIEADGSFQVKVPADTPIELQLIDERGISLRECGWIWTRGHQSQGCIGCHEDPERTPPNLVPLAIQKPSVAAYPPVQERPAVDFLHDVAPLAASKCNACHGEAGAPPNLDLAGASLDTEKARAAFKKLRAAVEPGRARSSPLVWHLYGENTAKPWDGAEAAKRSPVPIPAEPAVSLSEAEKQLFVRWIDLGASWNSRAGPAAQ